MNFSRPAKRKREYLKSEEAELIGDCLEEGCVGLIIKKFGDRDFKCTECKTVYYMSEGTACGR